MEARDPVQAPEPRLQAGQEVLGNKGQLQQTFITQAQHLNVPVLVPVQVPVLVLVQVQVPVLVLVPVLVARLFPCRSAHWLEQQHTADPFFLVVFNWVAEPLSRYPGNPPAC